MKMRLDQYLNLKGFFPSREKAAEAISLGKVFANELQCKKASQKVDDTYNISVKSAGTEYVSRSGNKLEAAMGHFEISAKDKTCLDIGSSTGGFTQYLIRNQAKEVFAVDVGSDQMHPRVSKNPRVKLFENTDIRKFKKPENLNFDLIVCDVSFISLRKIIPEIKKLSTTKTTVLLLFKPQFEVGREYLKKGICKNIDIEALIDDLASFSKTLGMKVLSSYKVPLKGKEGNQEYFLQLGVYANIAQ